MIKIENLSYAYGSQPVLKGLNLVLNTGKIHGLVGANGAGKSTFYHCLCGMLQPRANNLEEIKSLRRRIAYLPTHPIYLERMTGSEYLQMLCKAQDVAWENQNPFALPLNRYAASYSTGMKKKLALTGILMLKADIYILDEPFSGVDIHSNLQIETLIQNMREEGLTILISSHIFSMMNSLCDHIHLVEEGKIQDSYVPSRYQELESWMRNYISSHQNQD